MELATVIKCYTFVQFFLREIRTFSSEEVINLEQRFHIKAAVIWERLTSWRRLI